MKTVKIVHTADFHLGSKRTGVNQGALEIEQTFFNIINLCKSEGVDFLLIAGDLFDSPFDLTQSVDKIISALKNIPDTNVIISAGNHDCACPGSVYLKYDFPGNVYIFTSFSEYIDFPQKGVRIHGAGFTDRFENLPLLQSLELNDDFINIGVFHGDLVSNAESVYNPISPSMIEKSGLSYLALGHIHKRTPIQKLGNTYFAYSGCPDGTGFDEPGSQGIYIGNITKSECQLEYRETSSRKYITEKFDVSSLKNSFEIADGILENIKVSVGSDFAKNLYRVNLVGNIPFTTSVSSGQIQKILSEHLAYVEIFDQTDANIDDISVVANETSLRGIFVKKMLNKIDSIPPEEQKIYKDALKIGVQSFNKGVSLNDN